MQGFTLLPTNTFSNISRWIEAHLYPPHPSARELQIKRQQDIEHNAGLLRERISGCRTLQESYLIHDLINDYRLVWGESNQVKGHVYSLMVDLHRKQEDIVNKY